MFNGYADQVASLYAGHGPQEELLSVSRRARGSRSRSSCGSWRLAPLAGLLYWLLDGRPHGQPDRVRHPARSARLGAAPAAGQPGPDAAAPRVRPQLADDAAAAARPLRLLLRRACTSRCGSSSTTSSTGARWATTSSSVRRSPWAWRRCCCCCPLAATSTTGHDQAPGRRGLAPPAPPRLRGGRARRAALPLAGQEGAGRPWVYAAVLGAAARHPRVGRRAALPCAGAAGARPLRDRRPADDQARRARSRLADARPRARRWRDAPDAGADRTLAGPARRRRADGRRPHRARCSPTASCSSRRSTARPTSSRCSSGCAWAVATRRPTSWGCATTSSTCCSRARRRARPAPSTRSSRGSAAPATRSPRTTSRTTTCVVPVAHVRPAIELLADIAVNASFVPDELEAEKKVVFEEMNVLAGRSRQVPDPAAVRAGLRRAHPYGRPILGTPELVRSLTRDRLNAYYKKHYVPPNMVLVVVGPVPARPGPPAGRGSLRPAVRPRRRARGRPCRPVAGRRASRRRPAPGAAGRTSAWPGRRRPLAWRPRTSPPSTC